MVVAGWRGHRRAREASLTSGCKGPAYLFFLPCSWLPSRGTEKAAPRTTDKCRLHFLCFYLETLYLETMLCISLLDMKGAQ